MTDIEQVASKSTLSVLMQGDEEKFMDWTEDLGVDELVDVGVALTTMTKVSTLRAGYVAYRIRTQTQDGAWGEMKWRLAEEWDVSERTVQRWMSAAQAFYGFELTAAQANAKAGPPADGPSKAVDDLESLTHPWDVGGDDDLEEAGLTGYTLPSDGDPMDNRARFNDLVGEAGWGDDTLPSADYENQLGGGTASTAMLLPPDATWVAFTAGRLQAEHPTYTDQAAERMAKARWDRKTHDEPLALLEELELIHGEGLPEEMVAVLTEAEENRPIKPDAVEQPKEKRRSGGAGGKIGTAKYSDGPKNVERGMVYARQVLAHATAVLEEGGPQALLLWYGNTANELTLWGYAVSGCRELVSKTIEEAGAGGRPAAEPDTDPDDPGF